MRAGFIVPILFLATFSCTDAPQAARVADTGSPKPLAGVREHVLTADNEAYMRYISQRACALYVALRSRALEAPIAFDRDLEELPVHWNMCPGDSMVACVGPGAAADTSQAPIPWPY